MSCSLSKQGGNLLILKMVPWFVLFSFKPFLYFFQSISYLSWLPKKLQAYGLTTDLGLFCYSEI